MAGSAAPLLAGRGAGTRGSWGVGTLEGWNARSARACKPASLQAACRLWSFPALLEELGHETRPAGLVAGADPGPVVAVEVLVEEDQVLPVGVGLELLCAPVDRPPAVGPLHEDARQAAGQLGRDVPQGHPLAGARRSE